MIGKTEIEDIEKKGVILALQREISIKIFKARQAAEDATKDDCKNLHEYLSKAIELLQDACTLFEREREVMEISISEEVER